MSRYVRLKFSFQGYRNGVAWPPYNGVLLTDDEEARRLVAGQWAVYLEDEPEAAADTGFSPLKPWVEGYDPVLDPDAGKPAADDEDWNSEEDSVYDDDSVKRPRQVENKDAWIAYAVSQGEDPDVASRMTKADLVSKYGASL